MARETTGTHKNAGRPAAPKGEKLTSNKSPGAFCPGLPLGESNRNFLGDLERKFVRKRGKLTTFEAGTIPKIKFVATWGGGAKDSFNRLGVQAISKVMRPSPKCPRTKLINVVWVAVGSH